MVRRRGFGNDTCSRVLNQLELMEGLVRETKEERITIIKTRGDKTVDKDGGSVGGEGRAESVDIS